MVVRVPIEVQQQGAGVKPVIGDLQKVETSAKRAEAATKGFNSGMMSSTASAGQFAGSIGRMSGKLEQSAATFGISAKAMKTFGDTADVAEIGLQNLTKSAVGFNAASFGVAAAGYAIGTAIGSWLNTFPAVQKAADSLIHTIYRLTQSQADLDRQASATQGLKEFQKQMGSPHEQALLKQVAALREQGKTTKEIAEFYKGQLNPELQKRLGLSQEHIKAETKALDVAKKQADERRRFNELVKAQTSDRMIEEMANLVTMEDLLKAAPGKRAGGTAAAMVKDYQGSRLEGETLSGIFKAEADAKKAQAEATKEADERSQALVSTFGTLSQQLTNLAQVTGGFTGKLLGMLSALSSGAGGILSGLQGWKQSGGGFMGLLGKVSSGLGIAGSVVGAVGGLVSGFKSLFGGGKEKKEAAEASRILGETVSREQLKVLKEEAKAQGKDWRSYLRERAALDKKMDEEEARRVKVEGLKSAQSAAERLMDRMASGSFSDKLTGALGTMIGKVQEALLASGLGYMATPGLRESKEFMGAQGTAGDIADLIAGMRQGGAIDAGLLGAAGASAEELKQQAIDAATAAGMEPAEATKAGFGAIAPLLREQLNAALASGQELDANTKALIEEAKKNGVTILADPMVESVAVQKDMLRELKGMNRSGGGRPDEAYASGTNGLRLVKRDMLARIHEGEGFLVVPRDEMGKMAFRSFAKGSDRERDRGGGPLGRDVGSVIGGAGGGASGGTSAGGGTTSGGGSADLEAIVDRVASKIQTFQISNAPQVQIVDQSVVRTVEGQKRFERETVAAVERALDQNARGLESRIERIARRAVS